MNIRVENRRDPMTGDHFLKIHNMMFKDGLLYKSVSMRSVRTQNIQPSFDELQKFQQPNENGDDDVASLSTLFANRKKGHFMKGDRVIIIKGDLKNLSGLVERVDGDIVHVKPNDKGLPVRDQLFCQILFLCIDFFLSAYDNLHFPHAHTQTKNLK